MPHILSATLMRVCIWSALSIAMLGISASAQQPIGIFDGETEVGHARHGTTVYERERQTYMVSGSGRNMWNDRDDFHFVWKRATGNFILTTRARFLGKGVESHRKIGWTI